MNTLTIQGIRRIGQNRLEYDYTVEGDWSYYFEPSNPMWAEYSVPVGHVPDSIAVLPLIGNVIVLASLMDADIYVKEIDRDFYECVEEFLRGYDTIMPDHVHFKLRDIVHAEQIVDNPLSETEQAENLLFFSGGVDATCSLVEHLEEKPALVTIWGADIPWDNEESWSRAIRFNQEVADRYGLNLLTVRSNFRRSLQDDHVNDYCVNLVDDWWWSAFHHSVAMMCLAAPMAAGSRKRLYFGSTYSEKDRKEWGRYVTASDPLIDDHVRFCGCQVVHDGYQYSRYDKIKRIGDFYRNRDEKPYLRVCYLSNTGKNCCKCEKCASAIMSLLLSGNNPEDYGFHYDAESLPADFAAGMQEMARAEKYAFLSFYHDIQAEYRRSHTPDQVPPILRAFYEVELETLADFLFVPNNELAARDQSARRTEARLYDQIGQLQYKLGVAEEAIRKQEQLLCENADKDHAATEDLCSQLAAAQQEKLALVEKLNSVYRSHSWKVTAPLRRVASFLKKT